MTKGVFSVARLNNSLLCRLSDRHVARLDDVAAIDPPLKHRQEAIRRLIDVIDDDMIADHLTPAAVTELNLDPADVDRLVAALDARTRAYSELSKQVRHVGHFLNTLTRLGHQIASYGRNDAIPVEAIGHVQDRVESLLARMTKLAETDHRIEQAVGRCRS